MTDDSAGPGYADRFILVCRTESQIGALLREKRQHQRAELVTTVSVEANDNLVWQTQSRDISLGGMFLDGSSQVPTGSEVQIKFEMPKLGEVRVPGYVRWNTRDGFGIQFGLIGVRITHAIGAMILHPPRSVE